MPKLIEVCASPLQALGLKVYAAIPCSSKPYKLHFKFFIYVSIYFHMDTVPEYLCSFADILGGQKRALGLLGLEFQTMVSSPVVLRAASALNH